MVSSFGMSKLRSPRALYFLDGVSSPYCLDPNRAENKKHKATIIVKKVVMSGRAGRRSLWAATGPRKSCTPPPHPPPTRVRVSLRGRPARFSGDKQAADCAARPAPAMNQMRQVQLRWIPVIQPAWVCSSPHCRAAYLMSPKGGKKKKKKRRITLKYLQKLGCVGMIIKGCLTPPLLLPPRV